MPPNRGLGLNQIRAVDHAGPPVLILRIKCPCLAGAPFTPILRAVTNHKHTWGCSSTSDTSGSGYIAFLWLVLSHISKQDWLYHVISCYIMLYHVISCYIHSHHDIAILDIAIVVAGHLFPAARHWRAWKWLSLKVSHLNMPYFWWRTWW